MYLVFRVKLLKHKIQTRGDTKSQGCPSNVAYEIYDKE